ncbi:MAG: preprotein translocase subunit SecG [Planctomycetes bacterium]|nr:preprotein translocase subunit SecG [Planctomycetota bacterium]
MDPDELKKLLKRVAIIGAFFLVAVVFYLLGRGGSKFWEGMLFAYAIVVSLFMVLAILLQSGKGGGLASLGGMGGEALFGARSATPIAKATAVMGALFLFICMLISRLHITRATGTSAKKGDILEVPAEAPPESREVPGLGTGKAPDKVEGTSESTEENK